ncbi:hypothetical protein LEN26_016669 [Aphanomyces euteiches]|nr:hypothetical protein LEN26_016669 [Aphanomyces euteiches]KAH9114981.1 hypothetical protein AeMF1_010967 [Aphanomyces euteiches]KAH9195933.1 hypothetical protein AeNC1_002082 [Aphanomyces euteiches]
MYSPSDTTPKGRCDVLDSNLPTELALDSSSRQAACLLAFTFDFSVSMASPLVYLVTGANKVFCNFMRIPNTKLCPPGHRLRHCSHSLGAFGRPSCHSPWDRSLDNGKAAIAKMQQANPSFNYANVHLLEIDVTKTESIQAAADFVKTTYSTLHALVNNAGITEHTDGIDVCFYLNVYGVYATLSAFHPIMGD